MIFSNLCYIPLKNQVMFGCGAPSAWHRMVASCPSNTVMFSGATLTWGAEAVQ